MNKKMIESIKEMIRKLKEIISKLILKIKRKYAGNDFVIIQRDRYNLYMDCLDNIFDSLSAEDENEVKELHDETNKFYESFKSSSNSLRTQKIHVSQILRDIDEINKAISYFEKNVRDIERKFGSMSDRIFKMAVSQNTEENDKIENKIKSENLKISIARITLEMANSIISTSKTNTSASTESFITMCDELLIPAEEGWLKRFFAKSSSEKDAERLSKVWGNTDGFTDTQEKAKEYIKKVMACDKLTVDCYSLMAAAALSNLSQSDFIKIAKKFKDCEIMNCITQVLSDEDWTTVDQDKTKNARDKAKKLQLKIVQNDGGGNYLLYSIQQGKFYDYFHEDKDGFTNGLKVGISYNDMMKKIRNHLAKSI